MSKKLVGSLFGHGEDTRTFALSRKLILSRCNVGVEIECENVREIPHGELQPFWRWEEDHSLRNHGMEFKLSEPLFGEDLLLALDALCNVSERGRWEHGSRGGTHIHLDVRNLNLGELNKLCCLYAIAEPVFFEVGDPRRWESNFCVPWARESETIKILGNINHTHNESAKVQQVATFKKYSALNLGAVSSYGSVEFRQFPSTRDPKKLMLWINMVMCLKRAAKVHYENADAQDIITEFSGLGPDAWLDRIFCREEIANEIRKVYTSPDDMHHALWNAMRVAQVCANMDKLLFQELPRSGFVTTLKDKDFITMAIKEVQKKRKPDPKQMPLPPDPFPVLDDSANLTAELTRAADRVRSGQITWREYSEVTRRAFPFTTTVTAAGAPGAYSDPFTTIEPPEGA